MPLRPARRGHRAGVAAALALLLAAAFGCRREPAEEEAPLPALSRPGSRWEVTRGDRKVFALENAGGTIVWTGGRATEHPFISGESLDAKEERRIQPLVRKSRHFRDLVGRLQRAGYGVAPAPEAGPSTPPATAPPR